MCPYRGCRAPRGEGGQCQRHGLLRTVAILRRETGADDGACRGISHLDFRGHENGTGVHQRRLPVQRDAQGDPRVPGDPLRGDGAHARLARTSRGRREGRLDEAATGIRRLHLPRQHAGGPGRERQRHAHGPRSGLTMREVTVYSMEACVTCDQVKGMLDAREIPYKEIVLAPDSPAVDELAERSGMRTLPQVSVGAILVGGGSETMAAASSGMLDDLLVD